MIHTFSFWGVRGDGIKDIDKDKEKCDEESHSARNDIWRHDKTDPGDDNKQTYTKWTI